MKSYTGREILAAFNKVFEDQSNLWRRGRLEKLKNYLNSQEMIIAGTVVRSGNTYLALTQDTTLDDLKAQGMSLLDQQEIGNQWERK